MEATYIGTGDPLGVFKMLSTNDLLVIIFSNKGVLEHTESQQNTLRIALDYGKFSFINNLSLSCEIPAEIYEKWNIMSLLQHLEIGLSVPKIMSL